MKTLILTVLIGLTTFFFSCKKATKEDPAPPANPTPQQITVPIEIALVDYNNSSYANHTFSNSVEAKIRAHSGSQIGTVIGTYSLTTTNPPLSSTSVTTSPCYYGFAVNAISPTIEKNSTFLIEIYNNGTHIVTFQASESSISAVTYPINYTDTYTVAYECTMCCSKPFLAVVAR